MSVSEETFASVTRDVTLSAISAGFENVALMGDHGGGQQTLKHVAKALNAEWVRKGVHAYCISDLYFKEKKQMKEYLTKHNMVIDERAGIDDTSEVMFIDADNKWVRKDKLTPDDGKMGARGDPTQASTELGKMFVEFKIKNGVRQIRSLMAEKR